MAIVNIEFHSIIEMRLILVLFAIGAVAQADLEWNTLDAKWSSSVDWNHTDCFFPLPKTLVDAEEIGWVQVTETQNEFGDSPWCEENDPRVGLYYDVSGNIYGIQIAIPTADLEDIQSVYPLADMEWYGTATMFGQECWVTVVYTRNPEDIAASTASESDGLIGDGNLWIREYKSESYHYVSGNAITLDETWVEETCLPKMGLHYYKNIHPGMSCTEFQPWFLLYQDGKLTGVGHQAFGNTAEKGRNWSEQIDSSMIKPSMPTSPDCLTEWAHDYGFISLHFYFTAESWNIIC